VHAFFIPVHVIFPCLTGHANGVADSDWIDIGLDFGRDALGYGRLGTAMLPGVGRHRCTGMSFHLCARLPLSLVLSGGTYSRL
jgi:hypothetical protein